MTQVNVKHFPKKRVYVYKVCVVRWPSCRDDPEWLPDDWDNDWGLFKWPRMRVFLSITSAEKLANRLQRYGCDVEVVRSERVRWGDVVRRLDA